MVFLRRIRIVVLHQAHVTWEKVIVITTLNVLETLFAETTTVKQIFRPKKLTGQAVQTAVKVYHLFNLFIYFSDKVKF